MSNSKHGVVVLMGSGEMAASMVEVHKYAMSLVEGPLKAVFMDTPAGFQLNADLLSEKAVEFFAEHLNTPLEILSLKSVEDATPEQKLAAVNALYQASYIFAGPGSPTYALRNWHNTPIVDAIFEALSRGGCLTFASAAALTLGRLTIPVYEIYKVGTALHWVEGMNVLGHIGLDVCVVPHWNNNSGGDHDTRFCFTGEPRWMILKSQLPESTVILGVDEHTACILRVADNVCEVRGVGQVTVQRASEESVFKQGDSFSLDLLRAITPGASGGRGAAQSVQGKDHPSWDEIQARYDQLLALPSPPLSEVSLYIYDLIAILSHAREDEAWDTMRKAEQAIRGALVELLSRLATSPGNFDEIIGPYIELLLELRRNFRDVQQWDQADLIRTRLTDLGIAVEDGPQGTTWRQLT